jgi:PAS domain S-box-containing protein
MESILARDKFVLDTIPDIVYELDSDGRVVFINAAVGKYGYDPADLIGKDFLDFVHPEDREGAYHCINERRTGERRTEAFEIRIFDNKGNSFHLESKEIYPKSGFFELTSEGYYFAGEPNSDSFIGTRGIARDISERKLAEENRRLADERFRVYIENAPDPIFVLENGRYIEANTIGLKALGCTKEELIGATPWGPFSPKHQPDGRLSSEKAFEKMDAASAGKPQEFEWTHCTLDGTELEVDIRLNRTQHGGDTKLLAIFRDISERKREQNLLRQSESRLRRLAESFEEGLAIIERGHTVFANESAREILGCQELEDALEPVSSTFGDVRRQITPSIADPMWIDRSDGSKRFVKLRFNEFQGHNDGSISAHLVITDLTRQKEAEDSLSDNRILLESVMDSINEGIIVLDSDGLLKYANDAVRQWCSFDLSLYKEQRPWEVDDRLSEIQLHKLFGEARQGASVVRTYTLEVDHEERFVRIQLSAFSSRMTGINGVIGVISDLTEERRLRSQVFEAQKMEAIGTLAGGIAHDMNNILTAIHGYAELLDGAEDRFDPVEISEHSKEIRRAAGRASDLVKQILTFSRRSDGLKRPTLLRPIVEEAAKLLHASIPPQIEIRQHLDACDAHVLGDATRIHQVVMNLCTNAAQAMDETGGVIDLSLKLDRSSADQVELRVKDDGEGMGRETVNQVFTPFFTTKEKGRGTGLGLSVVYGIVKDMEGSIEVRSVPGVGTEFVVRLPMCEAESQDDTKRQDKIATGKGRVVLVDDETSLVRLGSFMVRKLGYGVSAFSDPQEALDFMTQNKDSFDILITDQLMPGLSGDDLIAKARDLRPGLPAVIVSGYSRHTAGLHADDLDYCFLPKPYSVEGLARTIAQALISQSD